MKLVVGLGNPGTKYTQSRHNVGFMVLDHLLKDIESEKQTYFETQKDVKSVIRKGTISGQEILLAKPTTYMNDSGDAVQLLMKNFSLTSSDMFVVYDDLDLPLGKIRVRVGGAAGGHKGVQSVIDALETDRFLRVRLGIGKPMKRTEKTKQGYRGVEEYVLSDFEAHEHGKVRTMVVQAVRIIKLLIKKGTDQYMSKYNKK